MNTNITVSLCFVMALLLTAIDGFSQQQDSIQQTRVTGANSIEFFGRPGTKIQKKDRKDSSKNDENPSAPFALNGMTHSIDSTQVVKPRKKD